MKTLLLDRTLWDLCLDSAGNIAVASDPYSQAQDAASAIKLFQGECFYNTQLGLPYFAQILGFQPSLALIKGLFAAAARTVPGVVSAQVFITAIVDRQLSGQVLITNSDGVTASAGF